MSILTQIIIIIIIIVKHLDYRFVVFGMICVERLMLLKLYAHALSARSYVRNDVVSVSPVSPHTDGCGAHPSSLCRAKILLRLSRINISGGDKIS